MMDNLMPDIPRIYTAVGGWVGGMLFFLLLEN